MNNTAKLERTTFKTSRLLDFCSKKELIAQTGHELKDWPLVVLKELVDNALDACEDAGTPPRISVRVDKNSITVSDNGPGIPAETVKGVLDFSVRVSSREAYVAPDRGAQGNALKTIIAIPFVLDGERGKVEIASQGVRHHISLTVDPIRQEPVCEHDVRPARNVKPGTSVTVRWPDSASSILADIDERFLQIAGAYTCLNPHLDLFVSGFGQRRRIAATNRSWSKWLPSYPTCAHWYTQEQLNRLIAAYIAHDADRGQDRTVRAFVTEFRGLSGTAKQKAVLEAAGLSRVNLSGLANGHGMRGDLIAPLLAAMQEHSKPVKPAALGVIGKDHLRQRFESADCAMETFDYRKVKGTDDGIPWVIETAFAALKCAMDDEAPHENRRLVSGVNWSPGIINPFRKLGQIGRSLDSVLSEQEAGYYEPVMLVLHMACARVDYTDRGKSAVVIGSDDGELADE